jgi:hypothetical protein
MVNEEFGSNANWIRDARQTALNLSNQMPPARMFRKMKALENSPDREAQ